MLDPLCRANQSGIDDRFVALLRQHFRAFHVRPQNVALSRFGLDAERDGCREGRMRQRREAANVLPKNRAKRATGGVPDPAKDPARAAGSPALERKKALSLGRGAQGALDSKTGQEVMELFLRLNREEKRTIVIVTHNMQQAARVADYTAFLYLGELVEYGETTQLFENPRNELTERYITGKFG